MYSYDKTGLDIIQVLLNLLLFELVRVEKKTIEGALGVISSLHSSSTSLRDKLDESKDFSILRESVMSAPTMRKSAPAAPNAAAASAAENAEVYYGEKNSGIRLVSTGKLDEEAEAARKALIRSMGKKPQNR